MVRVRHSPGITGTFATDEYGPFDIEGGILDIDDEQVAAALVEDHAGKLSWADEPPAVEADESADAADGDDDTQPGETVICGYYDEASMDHPCQRDAGWGTDESTGYCRPHRDD